METVLRRAERISRELGSVQEGVKNKFRTEWDDPVKQSFSVYLDELGADIAEIDRGIEIFREAVRAVEAVDMKQLRAEFDSLQTVR